MTTYKPQPHPICQLVRDLRIVARISLTQFETKFGIPGAVVAAYERGERNPPLSKIDQILRCFGYQLVAVPVDRRAIRLPGDLAAELRVIADQLAALADEPDQCEPLIG